jgi:hypothetical protein
VTPEDAEEYTQALGQVVAGGYRQVALGQRLGVPEALGISTQEWVTTRLGGYVKLSVSDRQAAVQELMASAGEGGMGLSAPEAAAVFGVNEKTIDRDNKAIREALGTFVPDAGEGLPESEHAMGTNVPAVGTDESPKPATLGELTPPDLELPPSDLSPIQKAASAISRTHVVTKFSPEEMAEAVMEMEALTDDPEYATQHLEKSRELAWWLQEMTMALNRLVSGARLRVVKAD